MRALGGVNATFYDEGFDFDGLPNPWEGRDPTVDEELLTRENDLPEGIPLFLPVEPLQHFDAQFSIGSPDVLKMNSTDTGSDVRRRISSMEQIFSHIFLRGSL